MKIPTNTLVIGIVTVLVLGTAYLYFFSDTLQPPLSAAPPASAAEQQFLNLAAELQPISFDTSLFNDPRFASLVDLSVPVVPESTGRLDPFAPVPGVPGK